MLLGSFKPRWWGVEVLRCNVVHCLTIWQNEPISFGREEAVVRVSERRKSRFSFRRNNDCGQGRDRLTHRT
jgi:hypothetical protein